MSAESSMQAKIQECIGQCLECSQVCLQTLSYSLMQSAIHKEISHITVLQLCADICQLSARAMIMGSQHHHVTCGACAEICEACAEDCRQYQDDEYLSRCAKIAQDCAVVCREMASLHLKTQDAQAESSEKVR